MLLHPMILEILTIQNIEDELIWNREAFLAEPLLLPFAGKTTIDATSNLSQLR